MQVLNTRSRPVSASQQMAWLMLPVFAMFLVTIGLALFQTVHHANLVEAERSRLAVNAALRNETNAVADFAHDNALWDEAARAVYAPRIDPGFAEDTLRVSTEEGTYFNQASIIRADGTTLRTYLDGRLVQHDAVRDLGPAWPALLDKMRHGDRAGAGMVRGKAGTEIVALAEILPTSPELESLVPAAGPHMLLVKRRLSRADILEIGQTLLLDEPRLIASTAPSETGIPLHDLTGRPIGQLVWKPAHSGTAALVDALPILLAAILLHWLVAGIVIRRGITSLNLLGHQALVDSLSKLPNRRALRRALDHETALKRTIGLALLDLDGFKPINDRYGHGVGDRLIQICADEMRRIVAGRAMVVRLGGDEFAVLASGDEVERRLSTIAGDLLNRFSNPIRLEGRTLAIGISIGLVRADLSEVAASEAMRRADMAMYAAKKAGKMRLTWYSDMLDRQREAQEAMAVDIQRALDDSEFGVAYQPCVTANDGRIRSVEALIRWQRPGGVPVPPASFLPVADQTGLVDRIGSFVIEQVAKDCQTWPGLRIAINVSRAQLRAPDFLERFAARLAEAGLPADRVDVEMREALFLDDPVHAERIARGIRAMGAGLVLDNFGAGMAALNILRSASFTRIKLDRALVTASERDDVARTLLQAGIAVARSMGVTVVAEGVETPEQAELMRVAGVDEMQGWLISRPVDAAGVNRLLTLAGQPPASLQRA